MLCSQMWNTKLQTDKSKFICWLERMVRGRGFWWPHLGLITVTVSDLLYMVLAQFKSVLITVTLTRESKIVFNLKCKWCCICCMFCVDVPLHLSRNINVLTLQAFPPSTSIMTHSHIFSGKVPYINLAWSATDLDLDLNLTLLIF